MSGNNSSTDAKSSSNASTPTKHEGMLSKWTNVVRGWQNRWFVLDPVHCTLEYYLTEEDRGQSPRASIKLIGSTIAPSPDDPYTFNLHAANGEVYKFKAHDVKERQKWVNMLRCVISPNYSQQDPQVYSRSTTTGSGGSSISSYSDNRRGSVNTSHSPRPVAFSSEPPSVKFEEPFAPSRLIISKVRDKRGEMCQFIETGNDDPSVSALTPDLLLLKSTSLASWDCLHQCLFALMNADIPDNGGDLSIYDTAQPQSIPPILLTDAPILGSAAEQSQFTTVRDFDSAAHSRSSSSASVRLDQSEERSVSPSFFTNPSNRGTSPNNSVGPPESMPTANDPKPTVAASDRVKKLSVSEEPKVSIVAGGGSPKSGGEMRTRPADGVAVANVSARQIVFANDEDELTDVEEDDSGELGSVESEKSVILHLIGQLKIGMDLTKVTLPTFILERRSLLEMFADYFGHAHILLRIPDMETEEQRMLGVLEWYLTSIHIVRKGTQAKKPYNPIIGETFHCSWKVPNEASSPRKPSSHTSPTGDLLRLKYVGEQVSHHPPVTAFYAECPEKKIYMNASIYTQSKFYGLSIGVNMIGMASVKLVQFGEEYTFTLPSAYARSILTVPWCELGGKVALECKKSGYSAEIVFHTKPFYGGKLHRVTADVTNAQGKSVCKVTGEWNSSYEFSMTTNGQKTVDVTSLSVIKKRCRPIPQQDPFESRRLWKNVTDALAADDIAKATQEKSILEDSQRKEEKRRKSADSPFANKFFHLVEGNWIFNEPLDQRQSTPS